MLQFVLYSRRGCHLCEEMLEELEPLCRGRATLTVRDIDASPELQQRFGELIPVLELDGREICRYQLERQAVIGLLEASAG